MKTLNLTQHVANPSQIEEGVVEPENKDAVRELLTFHDLPPRSEVRERAAKLAQMAVEAGAEKAMIGGAPFLMHPLHEALEAVGVEPVYAFSRRESVEQVADDGSVTKKSVFRHLGFV